VNYVLSPHAQENMLKRKITAEELDAVMQNPQQILDERKGRKIYQSVIVKDNRLMLLRAVVVVQAHPPVVVSVYETSQGRYWRQQP
jgi:hypothetical protein